MAKDGNGKWQQRWATYFQWFLLPHNAISRMENIYSVLIVSSTVSGSWRIGNIWLRACNRMSQSDTNHFHHNNHHYYPMTINHHYLTRQRVLDRNGIHYFERSIGSHHHHSTGTQEWQREHDRGVQRVLEMQSRLEPLQLRVRRRPSATTTIAINTQTMNGGLETCLPTLGTTMRNRICVSSESSLPCSRNMLVTTTNSHRWRTGQGRDSRGGRGWRQGARDTSCLDSLGMFFFPSTLFSLFSCLLRVFHFYIFLSSLFLPYLVLDCFCTNL